MVLDVDFTHICLFVDLVSFQLDFDHDIFLSLYLGGSLVPFGTLGLFRYDLEVKFDLVYLEKIFLYRAFAALADYLALDRVRISFASLLEAASNRQFAGRGFYPL